MARWTRIFAAAALVIALAACGGQPGLNNLFDEANAWTDEPPLGATIVTPDEFRRMVEAGRLQPRSTANVAEQARDRDARFLADRAYLAALPDPSETVLDLLAAAGAASGYQGDVTVTLGDETVMLDGLATQLANAVATAELAADVDNALAVYRLTYDLLPPDLRAQATDPAALAGKPLADVAAAAAHVDALLGTLPDLDLTAWEAVAAAPGHPALATLGAGNGADVKATCAEPTGFVSRLWFPLKSFLPDVKSQGRRGTCWAFTAVGAIESRELVQNGTAVNLSEQFLVNKVKHDWAENDYQEGYSALTAVNLANANRQALPSESAWTYNPSPSRGEADGNAAAYRGACDDYTGWCSETAHQSPVYCTKVLLATFCGYETIAFGGPGVSTGTARQLWASGQAFNLNTYRNLLAQGHVIMASFPVYEGFMRAPAGVVSDYAKKHKNARGELVDGPSGNHAVQIVAFFGNADLSTPGYNYDVGGGGYFVIKNSWGCDHGDGGYWYVPANYVWTRFNALYALDFDSRRSPAWTREQANPGSTEAPTVSVLSARPDVDLRVPTDLTDFFGVSHTVATAVDLLVTSSIDGTLYSGAWVTDRYAFPASLERTFTSVGPRTITVRASYAGNVTQKSFVANVVNTPPTLAVAGSGTAHRGEPYTLTASVSDINDADTAALCAATTWAVSAPDALSAASGCQVSVTFGVEGNRSVNVQTRDADGLVTARTFTFDVQPPPANPYPRVTGSGMYVRRLLPVGQVFLCLHSTVSPGAIIDLREKGCNFVGETGSHPLHWAHVDVENPSEESLTYDWRVYATIGTGEQLINSALGSADPLFAPYSPGNAVTITVPCRVTVRVNAPDPARSKTLTVWSGSCRYDSTRLN